jgi:ABC-type transport system involved in multi-copper enzyme maturation permease subunit
VSWVVISETVRRHVTNVGYGAYVALLVLLGFGSSAFVRVGSFWPSMVGLLAIIAGAGAIGPEFSSGTLQLILVKPVNRAVYLVSRVAGIVLVVWIGAAFAALAEILGRTLWAHALGLGIVVSTFVNACAAAILVASLLVLFGSLTRAYFNVAIYVVLHIGLSVGGGILAMTRSMPSAAGAFLTAHPIVEQSVDVLERNLFPEVLPTFDRDWLLLVLSNAAVGLLLACVAFRRREVPYGAD